MAKKVGIITQARMTSTRLPGKVLKEVKGVPLLRYHLDRLSWAGVPVVVATTVNREDDPIVNLCESLGVSCFRGDEFDVLGRFYGAAAKAHFDTVVRVTSDCPLIDGRMIAKALVQFEKTGSPHTYLSNCLKRTFPRGFDFEIFSFEDLQDANQKATEQSQREHVTPYINQNISGRIRILDFVSDIDLSSWRLTVDEVDDFKLMTRLIEDYGCAAVDYSGIKDVLMAHPELKKINQHIEQKKV